MKSNRILIIGLNLVLAVPLVVYAWATVYVRYMADDYCYLDEIHQYGLFGYPVYMYYTWSGKYAGWATLVITRTFGVPLAPFIALLGLVVWWLAIFFTMRLLSHKVQLPSATALSAFSATLLILATLSGSAKVVQTIYWQSSLVPYIFPLIFLTVLVWVLLQDRLNAALSMALCGLLALVAGGFSDVYTLAQTIILAAGCILSRRSPHFKRFVFALICSIVGLLLIVAAPGNANREAQSTRLDLALTVGQALASPGLPIAVSVLQTPLSVLALALIPATLAYYFYRRPIAHGRLYLALIPVFLLFISFMAFAPTIYLTSDILPARAITVLQYINLGGLIAWGFVLGRVRRRAAPPTPPHRVVYALAGLVVVVALVAIFPALDTVSRLKVYAQAWDARDAEIKAYQTAHPVPEDPATVMYVNNWFGLDEVVPDRNNWVNECVARYYNLPSIVAYPPNGEGQ